MGFDVLVVGAGPAGCAAAIHAATRGLRVALIEKAHFPRDLPGEALHPDVNRLFAELGVAEAVSKAGFISNPGWIRERSGDRSFIPFIGESGLQFGIQAWRSALDSILLAHARTAGVTVVQPASGARGVSERSIVWPGSRWTASAGTRAMWWTPQALAVGWRAVFSCPSKIFRHGWWRDTRTLMESWGSSLNSANTLVDGPGSPRFAKIAANVFGSGCLTPPRRPAILFLRMSVFAEPTSLGGWCRNVPARGIIFAAMPRRCWTGGIQRSCAGVGQRAEGSGFDRPSYTEADGSACGSGALSPWCARQFVEQARQLAARYAGTGGTAGLARRFGA